MSFYNLEAGTWPAFWMLENRIAESPRKIDLTVNDNGNRTLSVSSSLQFTVNDIMIDPDGVKSTNSSGGVSYYLMVFLFILLSTKVGYFKLP